MIKVMFFICFLIQLFVLIIEIRSLIKDLRKMKELEQIHKERMKEILNDRDFFLQLKKIQERRTQ